MAFDWLRTLDNHRVPYATAGKNVSKGNFVVHCPFCGTEDAGMHLSVALDGKGWRCFRRPDHRGKSSAKLLSALAGISYAQAARAVGDSTFIPQDFMAAVNAALSTDAPEPRKPLRMPAEFQSIEYGSRACRLAVGYLEGRRGYTPHQIEWLTRRWNLRYAVSGSYRGRIIFPVERGGDLLTWTGRHVGSSELRYKSLSPDEEKATAEGYKPALGPISNYLLFYDQLLSHDCDTLYLCEGPFDALKVCTLGWNEGAIATCCFTAAPSGSQIEELHDLFPKFKRKVLLLDNGTIVNQLRTGQTFSGMGLEIGELPSGVKDPGDLTRDQFLDIHDAA